MTLFELQAILKMDASDFDKGIDKAEKKASGFGSKLAGGLGKATKLAVGAVTAGATAVTAIGASSVKAGMDFDKAMSQVYATMGDNADKMVEYNGKAVKSSEALRSFAKEMGATTAFSATQSAEALNYMALAGYDAQKSMDMLPSVLNLASAGAMDLAQASDMVTDAQTALGLSTTQTKDMVDQMAMTSSKTNTSVKQLGEAMLTIGGTAKFMKGGTNELNQVLGILADNGIKGSEAGTHLRNMLLKLSDPTEQGAMAIEKLGLEVYDSEGKLRSFEDIFLDLKSAMKDYTDEEKATTFSALFNVRDVASATALLDTNKKRWEEVKDAIANAGFSVASFGDALEKKAGVNLETVRNNFADMGISAEQFDRILKDADGDTNKFVSSLMASTQAGTTQEDVINAMGGSLDKLNEAFSETTGSAEQMAKTQLDNLSGDITIFQSALEGAKIAISDGLSPTLREFTQFGTQGLSDLTKAMNEGGLSAGISMIGDLLSQALTKIVEKLPAVVDAGMQLVASLGQGILDNLPQITQVALDIVMKLVDGIGTALPAIIDGAGQVILMLAQGLGENLPTLIPKVVDIIIKVADTLINNIDVIVDAGIKLILGLAQGLINALPQLIEKIPMIIIKLNVAILKNLPLILSAGVQIILTLIEGIVSSFGKLIEMGANLPKKIKEGLAKHADEAKKWGQDMLDNFINGIKSKIGAIKDAVSNVAKTIKSILGFSEPETGPLSNFHTYAPDMMKLFAQGVKDNEKMLKMQVAEAFDFGEVGTISAPKTKHTNGMYGSGKGLIDYNALANAIVVGMEKSNIGIKVGEREFGRVVRSAVNYG